MFQFPACASPLSGDAGHSVRRVAPFGNPGINGHLRLPRAYRRLSRPSSPPGAKASTARPCSVLRRRTGGFPPPGADRDGAQKAPPLPLLFGRPGFPPGRPASRSCPTCQRPSVLPRPGGRGGQKPGPGVSLPARPHREARVYERGKESKAAARGKPRSRKEVFQPHLPVRLPCYDLAPVTGVALVRSSRSRPSGAPGSHGLTGGVYKARERIHRAMADARLLANPASWSRVADSSPNYDRVWRFAPPRGVAALCPGHCNTCVAPGVRAVLI